MKLFVQCFFFSFFLMERGVGQGLKPRKSRGQEGGGPEGWGPKPRKSGARRVGARRVGARRVGARRVGAQNFALFFPSPAS